MRQFLGFLLLAVVLPLPAESWSNPPGSLPARAQHRTFTSVAMKTEVGYNIYLPPDYATERERRWPVLYFLHPRGGHESSNTGAFALLDAAIRERRVQPFIYVHAMCGRDSGYLDAADGSAMGETVFIHELIPHIDATFRTAPFKEARGLEGFAMGGHGALLLAFKHPQLFTSVIAYAADLTTGAELRREQPDVFRQVHGDDVRMYDDASVWAWAERNAARLATGIAFRLEIGDQDVRLERNRRMDALLTRLVVPHVYRELPGIGHDLGALHRAVGVEGFIWHAQHFSQPEARR